MKYAKMTSPGPSIVTEKAFSVASWDGVVVAFSVRAGGGGGKDED